MICFKRNNCNTLRTLGATWLILKYNKFLFNETSRSSETGITVKPTPSSSHWVIWILSSGLKIPRKSGHPTLFQDVQKLHPFSLIHFDAMVNYTQAYFTFIFPFYTNAADPSYPPILGSSKAWWIRKWHTEQYTHKL